MLWHCEKCWDRYHNGQRDKDYIPPKYFGHAMMSKELAFKIFKEYGMELKSSIKEDKNKKYREGEYH